MRRRHLFWIASWLTIGMSACATTRPPRLETAKACADWRWIGISRAGARCPEVPGWTVRPLFPQVAPVRQKSEDYCERKDSAYKDYCEEKGLEKGPGPELIRELNRFCVYEPKKSLRSLRFPPAASSELVRVDRDCAALSASGQTDPEAEARRQFSEILIAQVGMPERPFTIANPFGVRLAILDTQPTDENVPKVQGNSAHGFTLAHIARKMVCADEGCAARITTQLTLPLMSFDAKSRKLTDINTERGGYLGMQSDLADAIMKEVDAWQDDRRGTSEQHLVLNLSLAWDDRLFGGDEELIHEMQAGVQAVYRALQYAASFDALVFAAAGNQKSEPCINFGPLQPGAWEIGDQREESCREAPKAPLLYAVGGVDSGGRPLINSRLGGMPRRVAYSENSVVALPDSEQYTASLTGSSVATAVVSSIAAVVWSTFPELSSSEVMDILDASGEVLPMRANFWFGASVSPPPLDRPEVHRLSLCAALIEACKRKRCPIQPQCPEARPEPFALPSPFGGPKKTWVRDSCQPWLAPQPESPPCLSCGPPGS